MLRLGVSPFVCAFLIGLPATAQDRPTKVRNDKARVEADGFWIYNDLPRGIAEAEKSRKPLLVVFRCIPCEACAQLDEQVVERDPIVQDLLAQFVCLRIVHANGMDLSLFQFDFDQSWAAFFLNADMTIYGRFVARTANQARRPIWRPRRREECRVQTGRCRYRSRWSRQPHDRERSVCVFGKRQAGRRSSSRDRAAW